MAPEALSLQRAAWSQRWQPAPLEGRASGARRGVQNYEGSPRIYGDFDFKDFLGFPIILLGFPRIS